jgi:hypothetical protein
VGFADSRPTLRRQTVAQIFGVYALRMAAVFLISQATLWLRTGVMPRWMAFLTFPGAVLLFIVTEVTDLPVFPRGVPSARTSSS